MPPVDAGPAQVIFRWLAAVRQRQDQITQLLTEQARELQELRDERDQLRRVVDDLRGKAAAERERQEQEAEAKRNRERERTRARVQRWRERHPEQVAQQRREDRVRRRKTQK